MKVIRKDKLQKTLLLKKMLNDKQVLQNMDSPFLVKMFYAFQTQTKLHFVNEYMSGGIIKFIKLFYKGDLLVQLRKLQKFSDEKTKFYCAQIILGLEYLHSKKIIYRYSKFLILKFIIRDLKPENILIDSQGNIKLNDFGFVKIDLEDGKQAKSFVGSMEYMAPEVALDKGHDYRADFWSLGAVMHEMLTGVVPLYSKNQADMIKRRLEEVIVKRNEISDVGYDLLLRLLEKDVQKRIQSIGEIKQHEYFREIDWDKLHRLELKAPYYKQNTKQMFEKDEHIEESFHEKQDKIKNVHYFEEFSFERSMLNESKK